MEAASARADAVTVFESLLNNVLLNFEACSAPEDVIDTIRAAMDQRPFINYYGTVTADAAFVAAYKTMLRHMAMFIVSDKHLKRSVLLHDVVMAMRFRLRPVFRILFPDYEEDHYKTY
jgi:hypothetical protein